MKTNPTLILCAAVLCVFVGGLAAALALPHPGWPILVALAAGESVTIFVLYIVIHDAAHRSASKHRRLNEVMLFACGVVFLFDPYLYRRLHLTHHAHTNEESDPDRFTASRFLAVRWAKSFLIAVSYYIYAVRRFRKNGRLFLHLAFTPTLIALLWIAFHAIGRMDVLVAGWFVPAFIAIGFLGFVLTAWPHHPAESTDPIGSARNLNVPKVVQWLLGYQHLHLVHHYAPSVPWHGLQEYWRANKDRLVATGAPPIP